MEFFSTDKVKLRNIIYRPDIIVTKKSQGVTTVTVKQIKEHAEPEMHHFLQVYVYKLVLEQLLTNVKHRSSIQISASIIHLCDTAGRSQQNVAESIAETIISKKHLATLNNHLSDMASLLPRQDISVCDICPRFVVELCDWFAYLSLAPNRPI